MREFEDTDDVLPTALLRRLNALQVVPGATAADVFRLATVQIHHAVPDLAREYSAGGVGPDDDASGAGKERANESFEPRSLAFGREFHERVHRVPENERDAFERVWYQELTQEEAAAVLQCCVPTVWRRWLRARLRLKDYLHVRDGRP
jgi:DNA-directed RNA polymerase specialized sigma24 family protein